jgi:hypothetical protein
MLSEASRFNAGMRKHRIAADSQRVVALLVGPDEQQVRFVP